MAAGTLLFPSAIDCGCGAPTRLHFAELNEEHKNEIDFSVGKTVQYTCRPGYTKHPGMSPTITCLESGVWSEALEFCKNRIQLPTRPHLEDHFIAVTPSLGQLFMPHIRGKGISSPLVLLLNLEALFCASAGIPCKPPPDIPNGKHTGRLLDEFYFGTSVTYTCNRGYPLHGEPSIYCTTRDGKNGEWSGPPPQCGGRVARCPVPQVQNGRIVSPRTAYTHKDTIAFECEPGYVLHGHRVVQCQLNNTWEPPVPVSGCNAPTSLAFAELKKPYSNQTVFPVGSTVEYVCRPGYAQHLGMSPTITCLRNRTWSGALDVRLGKQCANPGDPENGRAVVLTDLLFGHSGQLMDTFSYADVVTYTCDAGHPLAGEPSIFCTTADGEHGVWSGPPPRCGGRARPSPLGRFGCE
uniref:Sushi domain-containing protein n=1 Tax=Buteo japonicus TaxID=224669 RepID=A0A8B9Z243_9AVES